MTILVQLHKKLKPIPNFQIKSVQDVLHDPKEESVFTAATDVCEGNLIISSLNSDKSTGLTSLPAKILKLKKLNFFSPRVFI